MATIIIENFSIPRTCWECRFLMEVDWRCLIADLLRKCGRVQENGEGGKMRMDDLISKMDALDKVHKTIENLILRLPRVRGVDGEDYCTDPASLAAYNIAYAEIRREIQNIPSWNTEEPEVVRCGKCVNWKEDFPYNTCELFGGRWNENMFCWYGERKDG